MSVFCKIIIVFFLLLLWFVVDRINKKVFRASKGHATDRSVDFSLIWQFESVFSAAGACGFPSDVKTDRGSKGGGLGWGFLLWLLRGGDVFAQFLQKRDYVPLLAHVCFRLGRFSLYHHGKGCW